MNWIKNNIPNLLTCLNLSCGFWGICIFIINEGSLQSQISNAAFLILLAGVFDFFDGFAARLLKSASNIGKDLDSLADMVTFGVLPGVILFSAMNFEKESGLLPVWVMYSALLVPVFSAIRLAIFNNDTRQTDQFIGVPTPANAFLISFLLSSLTFNNAVSNDPWILPGISFSCSIMLVAPIPLIALKFKDFSFETNKARFILIAISLGLFTWLRFEAIPLIIIVYIALSILNNLISKK